jgi:hypothetical protein
VKVAIRKEIAVYISRYDTLEQVPTLHGFFAGPLGESPFSAEIREFLKQVENRSRDFRKLLLTVTFHPKPMESNIKVTIGNGTFVLLDASLFFNLEPPVIFLDELRRIRDKFRTQDTDFKGQIEAELQLRNEMIRAAGDSATRLLLQKKLQPMLVEASLTEDFSWVLCKLGLSSAQKLLPAALVQRIRNSEVSEAHLTNLGKFLRRYGEVLQGKDPAFKDLVEKERNRRRQVNEQKERTRKLEEERKKRQQRRRRP